MRFPKADVIKTIKANRDEHREIFDEALVGYKAKVLEELDAHLERVRRGEVYRVYVMYPQPADHTRDYDRIISMLELTDDPSIELTEGQFAKYMQDDWEWKQMFLSTNSAYSAKAGRDLEEL